MVLPLTNSDLHHVMGSVDDSLDVLHLGAGDQRHRRGVGPHGPETLLKVAHDSHQILSTILDSK